LEQLPVDPPSAAEMMAHPNAILRPASELVLRMIGNHVLKRARERAAERGLVAELLELADTAPALAIVAAAEAEGVDTIVMGMRGLSLSDRAIIGSVSQEVCRTAACTCIAVH
jgi:nucleotide-binding universal stress UspA family protein